ncbi:MAG: hypothetical protein ABFS19_08490 [Thermodesulfobacteriota bacterium]
MDKKEMNIAVLIQLLGFLLIFVMPGLVGGILALPIGVIVGVSLIGFGYRKYRRAKYKSDGTVE